MTGTPDPATPEQLKAQVEARGLTRAYALFPDQVAAAQARASTSLSPLPAEVSPTTEPAVSFDAAAAAGQPR